LIFVAAGRTILYFILLLGPDRFPSSLSFRNSTSRENKQARATSRSPLSPFLPSLPSLPQTSTLSDVPPPPACPSPSLLFSRLAEPYRRSPLPTHALPIQSSLPARICPEALTPVASERRIVSHPAYCRRHQVKFSSVQKMVRKVLLGRPLSLGMSAGCGSKLSCVKLAIRKIYILWKWSRDLKVTYGS